MKKTAKKKPDLAQLKREWYKKLKKEGFDDIEADETRLKTWSSGTGSPYRNTYKYKENMFDAKADYYRLAEHFLNEHRFKNNTERTIWEYHANGIGFRSIVDIYSELKIKQKITVHFVRYLIKDLREKMFRLYGVNTGRTNEQ